MCHTGYADVIELKKILPKIKRIKSLELKSVSLNEKKQFEADCWVEYEDDL